MVPITSLPMPEAQGPGSRKLRRRTDIPIIWDELTASDETVAQIISEDAAEGIGLKISKNGGLTKGRRQQDMCISAGYTVSVQETIGSDITFAAIVQLGQTVPEKYLRCVLECRDTTPIQTADGNFTVIDGCVTAPLTAGLGITPRLDVLGEPVTIYIWATMLCISTVQ